MKFKTAKTSPIGLQRKIRYFFGTGSSIRGRTLLGSAVGSGPSFVGNVNTPDDELEDELDDDELDELDVAPDELDEDVPDELAELDELDELDVDTFGCGPSGCGATYCERSIGILSSPRKHILFAPSVRLSQTLYPSGHSPEPWHVREQKPAAPGASAFFTHSPWSHSAAV